MQSQCLAISPNLIYSYAWKTPAGRPVIFERGQASSHICEDDPSRAAHPSVPWKAYLASRAFQHLASDFAEAFFTERPSLREDGAPYPAILLGKGSLHATADVPRGLLAPAVPGDACSESRRAIAA